MCWLGVNICVCLRVSERMRSVFFSVLLKTETRERIGIRKRERNECLRGREKGSRQSVLKSNTAPLLGSATFTALPIFP